MPDPARAKVFWTGTHRVRQPAETLDLVTAQFPRFGITRIADVTGLDTIGIPVALAVRPLARSLSVSQGKGQTLLLAKVSAAMESVEHWHAEHASPQIVANHVPARELGLPYRVSDLDLLPGALVSDHTPLDWVRATGLSTGCASAVPLELVCLADPDARRWAPIGLRGSTNGLASGNSLDEAALHALYEVIERAAVSERPDGHARQFVDPDSVTDPACASMFARLRSAQTIFDIEYLPNRFGVPCFAARIWSEELPVTCLGFGAHSAPEVALSRAVTEAAQSRLTAITGSREDLPPLYDLVAHGTDERPQAVAATAGWAEVAARPEPQSTDVGAELARLSGTVADVLGVEPLLVDLSTDDEFAVVKVVVPGTRSDLDRFHTPG